MNLKPDEIIGHIGEVLTDSQKKRGILIYAFQGIQREFNYLPEDALGGLAVELGVPLSDVYSTATFYKQFYFTPQREKDYKGMHRHRMSRKRCRKGSW